mmetsp:Transcript_22238/g.57126  ORF Transcript_22238/g.57126 Transcript_22238/m.57126 type:complete len:131 (-) Transcript_22238:165-557(-)
MGTHGYPWVYYLALAHERNEWSFQGFVLATSMPGAQFLESTNPSFPDTIHTHRALSCKRQNKTAAITHRGEVAKRAVRTTLTLPERPTELEFWLIIMRDVKTHWQYSEYVPLDPSCDDDAGTTCAGTHGT